MMCKCGEILLVNYPFTDHSGSKVRPVLVVSADRFNQGDDIVVVPISSVFRDDDQYAFPVRASDSYFRQTGLRGPSRIKWTKPMPISERVAHRRLGSLASRPLTEVRARVRSLFQE